LQFLEFSEKIYPTKPDPPAPPVGTIFAMQKPDFFNTFTLMRNMRNKMRKILENQGFEALRSPLRKLYASFTQTYQFAKNLL
jgi:hypothetical protein